MKVLYSCVVFCEEGSTVENNVAVLSSTERSSKFCGHFCDGELHLCQSDQPDANKQQQLTETTVTTIATIYAVFFQTFTQRCAKSLLAGCRWV